MNLLSLLTIIALSGAIVGSYAGSSKLGVRGHPGGGGRFDHPPRPALGQTPSSLRGAGADKPGDRISTLCLIVLCVVRLRLENEALDRRSFVTSVLLSVGILTVSLGAADALPAVAPLDDVVSATMAISKPSGRVAADGGVAAGIGATPRSARAVAYGPLRGGRG